eukprot:ANDGO_03853.mRNA.1 hypothetical protein AURANDRAFT_65479
MYLDDNYFKLPRETGYFDYGMFSQNTSNVVLGSSSAKMENRTFQNDDQEFYMTLTDGVTSNQLGYCIHNRVVSVKYGFESTFKIRIRRDHAAVYSCGTTSACADRELETGDGAMPRDTGDGFVFVVSAVPFSRDTLPSFRNPGKDLGYDGMRNTLAVEFDLAENEDKMDPNDAHVSVQFKGSEAVSSRHSTTFPTVMAPDYGSIQQFGDNYTQFLTGANRTLLSAQEQLDYDVIHSKLDLFLWSDPRLSQVNYIHPNVTPPYNWADIGTLLDNEIHEIRIVYMAEKPGISVYFDGRDDPVLQVAVNVSKMHLHEDYLCKHYNGCFARSDYYFNETEREMYRRPICEIYAYPDKQAAVQLFTSNVTSDKQGKPFIVEGPRGPLGCQECFGYEGCGAYVSLLSATGSKGSRVEVFSWKFTSTKPDYTKNEFVQGPLPKGR